LGHRTVAQYLQKVGLHDLSRILSVLLLGWFCLVVCCRELLQLTWFCLDLLELETEVCAELPNAVCRSKCSLASHHQDLGRECNFIHFGLCAC
jgi:hypothetical protein